MPPTPEFIRDAARSWVAEYRRLGSELDETEARELQAWAEQEMLRAWAAHQVRRAASRQVGGFLNSVFATIDRASRTVVKREAALHGRA